MSESKARIKYKKQEIRKNCKWNTLYYSVIHNLIFFFLHRMQVFIPVENEHHTKKEIDY